MNNWNSAYGSLRNATENVKMKVYAKEILLEENYEKFIKSFKYMFWFQITGILAGFIVPCVVIFIATRNMDYAVCGLSIGIFWAIIWMILSMFVPKGRIYRDFAKWYRNSPDRLDDLEAIFNRK